MVGDGCATPPPHSGMGMALPDEGDLLVMDSVHQALQGSRVQPRDRLALAACQLALAAKELPHTIEAQNMLSALSPGGAQRSMADACDDSGEPLPAQLVAKALIHLTQAASQMPHALGAHQMLQALDTLNPEEELPEHFTMDDVVGMLNTAADAADADATPPAEPQHPSIPPHSPGPAQVQPFAGMTQRDVAEALAAGGGAVTPGPAIPPPPALPAVVPVPGCGRHFEVRGAAKVGRHIQQPQQVQLVQQQPPQQQQSQSQSQSQSPVATTPSGAGGGVPPVPFGSPASGMMRSSPQQQQQQQQAPQPASATAQHHHSEASAAAPPRHSPTHAAVPSSPLGVTQQQHMQLQRQQMGQLAEMQRLQQTIDRQQAQLQALAQTVGAAAHHHHHHHPAAAPPPGLPSLPPCTPEMMLGAGAGGSYIAQQQQQSCHRQATPLPSHPSVGSQRDRCIRTPTGDAASGLEAPGQLGVGGMPQFSPHRSVGAGVAGVGVGVPERLAADRAHLECLVTMHRRMAALPPSQVDPGILAGMMLQIDIVKERILSTAASFAASGGDLTETAAALSSYLRGSQQQSGAAAVHPPAGGAVGAAAHHLSQMTSLPAAPYGVSPPFSQTHMADIPPLYPSCHVPL